MVLKPSSWLLALGAGCLLHCASSRPDPELSAFERRDVVDSLPVADHNGDTSMFYGFSLEGIPDSMVANLIYVGSVPGKPGEDGAPGAPARHAFIIDQRYRDGDRAYRILLDETECEMENPRDVMEENMQYGSSPRRAERRAGRCRVPDPLVY